MVVSFTHGRLFEPYILMLLIQNYAQSFQSLFSICLLLQIFLDFGSLLAALQLTFFDIDPSFIVYPRVLMTSHFEN
jgi:hypothetical protein